MDRTVSGRVVDRDGRPVVGALVRAFARGLRDERPLGEVSTDVDGQYTIAYPPDGAGPGRRVSLRVAAFDDDGRELASAPVRFRAADTETVDLTLPDGGGVSEYERYLTDLRPELDRVPPGELTGQDLLFLAADSGIPVQHLTALAEAARRGRPSGRRPDPGGPGIPVLPAEVWYAWHRAGVDLDSDSLWRRPLDDLVGAVRGAVDRRVIPASIGEHLDELAAQIRTHRLQRRLDRPVGAAGGAIRELLATLPRPLEPTAQHAVAEVLGDRPLDLGDPGEPGRLARRLQRAGLTGEQADDVVRTLRLGEITGGHPPLVAALQPLTADDGALRRLAELSPDTWLDLAYQHGTPDRRGAADEIGGTDEIGYARLLRATVERLHPTATLAARLADGSITLDLPGADQVVPFLREHPAFDIIATPIDEYLREIPTAPGTDRTQLADAVRTLRRVRTLSPSWDAAAALLDAGLTSAVDVARRSPTRLAAALAGRLSDTQIATVHARAGAAHDASVALLVSLPRFTPTGVAALPTSTPSPALLAKYPTLQALFGSLDGCACGQCRSVLGPAAYLVDLLEFLRREAPDAFAALLHRRPDLVDLELSCENTERELPAIDLALEALENAVALPLTVELPPGTDVAAALAGGPLPQPVVDALRRTAVDVGTTGGGDLRATPDPAQLQQEGFTSWTVTNRGRRWSLQHADESLLVGVRRHGRPVREPVSAGLNVPAEVAALDQGSLLAGLDGRLRPYVTEPALGGAVSPGGVTVVVPGRHWRVRYLVELTASTSDSGGASGTLTLATSGGGVLLQRSYSAAALAATATALRQGSAGAMLTTLIRQPDAYQVGAGSTANSWLLKKKAPVDLDVYYTPGWLTVAALSYQSRTDSAELLAFPHNRNPEAYRLLSTADVPWSLPFDLPLEETRALLEQAGCSRLSLMRQWFAPVADATLDVGYEHLGLSAAEVSRITKPVAASELWRLWGVPPVNGVSTVTDLSSGTIVSGPPDQVLSQVSVLLQQSGLDLAELRDLLESRFVCRSATAPAIEPANECRPSKMTVDPVDAAFFDRLRRFVLLWRALGRTGAGWSAADLDIALAALADHGEITAQTVLNLSHVERLRRALGLGVPQLVPFWGTLGTTTYHRHTLPDAPAITSLYDRLFIEPSGDRTPDPDFALNPNRTVLACEALPSAVRPKLAGKLDAVAAAFRIRPPELKTLHDEFAKAQASGGNQGPLLGLANLAALYRMATLSRALGLTAGDYLRLVTLTGIDPFRRPQSTVELLDAVATIRAGGSDLRELDYMLRGVDNGDLASALPGSAIGAILAGLRTATQATRDAAGNPVAEPQDVLRADLTGLGWYPELVDETLRDLTGSLATALPDTVLSNGATWSDLVTIPPSLAGLVGLDDGGLRTYDFLPPTAWDRTDPGSLYQALSTTAATAVKDAFEDAVDALATAATTVRARLARRLRSADLPVLTAVTGPVSPPSAVPAALRDRCHVEATADGKGSRIVVNGWVDGPDATALAATLGSNHSAAIQALRAASDGYAETSIRRRLLTADEADDLPTPGRSAPDRCRWMHSAVVRHGNVATCATQLGAAVGLPQDVTLDLLVDALRSPGGQAPAVEALLDPAFAETDSRAPVDAGLFPSQFALVRRLHRIGLLVSRFGLDRTQLRWLAGTGPGQAGQPAGLLALDLNALPAGLPQDAPVRFVDWRRMVALVRLRDRAPGAPAMLDRYVTALTATGRTEAERTADAVAVLAVALDVDEATVADAAGQVFRSGFTAHDPIDLTCLLDLVTTLSRLGLAAAALPALIGQATSAGDGWAGAAAARAALRGRYGDAGWLEILRPVSDSLRARQRDALVSYLVHRDRLRGADELYELYLIDTLTVPCLTTTRLLHAVAAVQLFVHRCLLGVEPSVPASDIDRTRWEWMRTYRIWEANRKVFLYPENWLHPELREDASDAFRTAQSALGRGEPSTATARDALLGYLDDLAEAARLSVVGMFCHPVGPTGAGRCDLYVVARTADEPYRYFWRVCEDFAGSGPHWHGWERVDLDISGTHVMPFVLAGDLHLAWPVIRRAEARWEVQLAWTRQTARGWTQKHLSRATVTAPVLTNLDERRTFAFRVDVSQLPATTAADGSLVLTGPANGQVRVYCYHAKERTSKVQPWSRAPDDGWAPREQLIINCRALYQDATGNRWYAHGMTVELLRKDTATGKVLVSRRLNDTDARGMSYWTETRSDKETAADWYKLTFELSVTTPDGTQNRTASTSLAAGFPARTWYPELSFNGEQAPPEFTAAERPVDMVPLGTFVFRAGESVEWTDAGGPKLDLEPDLSYENGVLEAPLDAPSARTDDALRLPLPAPSTLVLPATPGRFFLLRAAPMAADIWHYRDGVGQYYLRAVTGGRWLVVSDGHPLADRFRAEAATDLAHLFRPATQAITDGGTLFAERHQPDSTRLAPASLTSQGVSFEHASPYAPYNWELFLHLPLLLAAHLSAQQRFAAARQWLHLVFDPTSDEARAADAKDPSRFWRFLPFRSGGRPDRIEDLLAWLANPYDTHPGQDEFVRQIALWRDNPFRPHVIARVRPGAYQWRTLFDYLDNLIAWGDERFRRDTRESLVEATMLYVLAAQMLGPRPRTVAPQESTGPLSYRGLAGRWDEFSNAWLSLLDSPLVQAWLALLEWLRQHGSTGSSGVSDVDATITALGNVGLTYFCVPPNEKLVEYWNRVEDRLFKLRHCQNIDGVARDLPLFEPPIDPDLLVRAVAAGVDLDQAVAAARGPLSPYRYPVLTAKAAELCAEVRTLGAELLAALEKRDAERLATLRSGQEVALLELVTEIRQQHLNEATADVDALTESRRSVAARWRHVQHLLGRGQPTEPAEGAQVTEEPSTLQLAPQSIRPEEQGLALIQAEADQLARLWWAEVTGISAGVFEAVAAVLFARGKQEWGHAAKAMGAFVNSMSSGFSHQAARDALIAGHQRRRDDLVFQANSAAHELAQLDKQLAAARIRVAIAERELTNHWQQIANARTVDDVLRDKYTNEQLYTWMSGQLGGAYFAAYELALDLTRQAERALRYELAQPGATFIQPRYWDTMRNGLLAGERLAGDLRRMDAAYLTGNRREHELTRYVSLLRLDPLALLRFRLTGTCEFSVPETLFDMDCPGHFLRRLKSVGLSIPCVVGPYAAVHCRLTLLHSTVRHRPDLDTGYARHPGDRRFTDDAGPAETVVTSGAVDASGMWELSLHDERRLPFEGRGAISTWRLELPADFRPFDYASISDVILHLRYSARDGGARLSAEAVKAVKDLIAADPATDQPLACLISVRHDFPTEWARFTAPTDGTSSQTLRISGDRFPYVFSGRKIDLKRIDVFGVPQDGATLTALPSLTVGGEVVDLDPPAPVEKLLHSSGTTDATVPADQGDPRASWTVTAGSGVARALKDLILVATFRVSEHGS